MLKHLTINNLAIIDEVSLDLAPGFTVLTGETGAGKSILIDAIGLVLGDRGDSNMVRHGSDKADISAEFDLPPKKGIRAWLRERELDDGDHCLLRRTINKEGRSRAFINSKPVSLQALKELGEHLLEIQGQHEHQALTSARHQLYLLDGFAGELELSTKVRKMARNARRIQKELNDLQARGGQDSHHMKLVQHQVDELKRFDLQLEELEQLDKNHRKLSYTNKIIGDSQAILDGLDSEEASLLTVLSQSGERLQQLADYDESMKEPAELLESASVQISDALGVIRKNLSNMELDSEELKRIENRLTKASDLARKHQVRMEDLPDKLAELQNELLELADAEERIQALEKELEASREKYHNLAKELSKKRYDCSVNFTIKVTEVLHQLGMPHAQFDVTLQDSGREKLSGNGFEEISFRFSANPGTPPREMSKVASGGELSRLALALRVITLDLDQVPSVIFDEIDAGIGGPTADLVGENLRNLGEKIQVLCVTHQPQVAGKGHQHFHIEKTIKDDMTHTTVRELNQEDRVNELARMLGGKEDSEQTRLLAEELLSRSA